MSFEHVPSLSEQNKTYLSEVAEKMIAGDEYLTAVRQVLVNHHVTHEPDVRRIMSELASHIDAEVRRKESQAEAEEDIRAAIATEREEKILEDMQRVAQERGGDPED